MVVVRFAGYGGQGLLTAGLILADAAALYEQKKVIQTQSYGPEARGGASKSDVVVSDEEIAFPKPDRVDVLVAMNQTAVDRYTSALADAGVLLADATFVTTVAFPDTYLIPFTQLARNNFNRELVANVIALGAVIEIKAIVSREAVLKALEHRVPQAALDMNKKALEVGMEAARAAAAARAQAEKNYDIV